MAIAALVTGCALGLLVGSEAARGAARDDTEALQARLDRGGQIFLPKLPDGACYQTRGLWLSRDDTAISSDGACIVALGPGEARIRTGTGRPVPANGVFFLNHSNIRAPLPVRVAISGLHITVPAARRMTGISVFAHEVTLSRLTIDGAPTTDVLIGEGKVGFGGAAARVSVTDSTLSGAQRNVISAFGSTLATRGRSKWPASRRLKGLARELNIPVLCLAQLNRQVEATRDSRPQLSHLRESGAIEQDADVVAFIHREEFYQTNEEDRERVKGQADLLIRKQRNGPTGDIKLTWLHEFTRFENWQQPEYDDFTRLRPGRGFLE